MLEVGRVQGSLEWNRAHFGAWCIISAPLILGIDLTQTDSELTGFYGGFSDGSYGYCLGHYNNGAPYGKVARIDVMPHSITWRVIGSRWSSRT